MRAKMQNGCLLINCLNNATINLWFGFESSNWIMKQKIILEVVPWVDTKLSRGWTVENRKFIIDQCKTSAVARKLANSDDFVYCRRENSKKYKFQEFQKLLVIEQIYKDNGKAALKNQVFLAQFIMIYVTKQLIYIINALMLLPSLYLRIINDGKQILLTTVLLD
jgi:hypothetical protein